MTRVWLRRTAIGAGALLLLLAGAVAVLIATFDANRYKALAIDWMRTEHQRTLAIDGPVSLSLLPRLAVRVSGLRLSERGRADEFLAVDDVALAVRVLPLWRGRLVVDRVSARGVRAAYLRDAGGVRNLDDLLADRAGKPAAGGGTGRADTPLRFDISAVQLDDLQLRVRDALADVAGELTLHSLTSGRLADGVDSPLSLRASVKLSRPQPLTLTLDGRMRLVPDLAKATFALTGMQLDLQGEAAAAKGLSLALAGALAWDGNSWRAGPLQLNLKGGSLGPTTLAPSTLAVDRLRYSPAQQQFELQALTLALAGRQGSEPFELSLNGPKLAMSGQQVSGEAINGRFKLSGTTALDGSFSSAAPGGNFDTLRLPGVQIKLQGQTGARRIDGSIAADLALQPGRASATVDRLDLRATLTDAGQPPLQLALRGQGRGDAAAASWNLEGSLNDDRFESSGKASFAAAVPRVEATARFDSLDLNRLLPPPATPAATGAAADTPLPLDGLDAIDGRFRFAARTFALRTYRVTDAQVEASLDGGRLQVTRLAGRTWGGSVEASGSAESHNRRVAIKLAAEGVDVEALLKDVAGKDLLEGRGRVVADLGASGATLSALRSSLAGSASLRLRDGAIKGINLARTMRQARAALSNRQDVASAADTTAKTDFTELSASARIVGGVAQSDDLDLRSPFLRIGGAGRFDIGGGRIDYTARATVTDAATGQGGADLAALRGVTVPVRLTGPLDAIDWKIEWSGVAAAAVQKRLEEKILEKLGGRLGGAPGATGAASAPARPEDLLKERLRGLFR